MSKGNDWELEKLKNWKNEDCYIQIDGNVVTHCLLRINIILAQLEGFFDEKIEHLEKKGLE